MTHRIASVEHLSPEPQDGYLPTSPVKITYLDGSTAFGHWSSDVDGGGVLAWRAEKGDEAAIPYQSPPAPVPQSISDRQFAHALWQNELITFEEAMAFVQTGTIPEALAAAINEIPDEATRKSTMLLVAGAIEYRRSSPAVAVLASVLGWNDAEVDALWTLGASL